MEKGKKIVLWILTGFLLLTAIAFMPSVSSFMALAVVVIIAPVQKWQDVLGKVVKGKIKAIICAVLVVAMFISVPTLPGEENGTKTESTTEKSTEAITTDIVVNEGVTVSGTELSTDSNVSDTTENTQTEETTDTIIDTETQSSGEPSTAAPVVVPETNPAHVHNYKDATCTTPKTCTSCGETEGNAKGHSWKEATCTTPKVCNVCGETSGDALGHSYSGGKCNRCGANDPDYVKEEMVWVPADGEGKYHSKASCSGMVNPQQLTKEEAIQQGYQPCKRCH